MSSSASERGKEEEEEEEEEEGGEGTALVSLNHVSFVCRSVTQSVKFYEKVLGFASIRRPSSFNFKGAWLFNYGIGIHLLQCISEEGMPRRKEAINPKDNHISFQCSNIRVLKNRLEKMGIEYVTAVVEEGGVRVNQLFFHDPDGHMIEICNCEDLRLLPLSSPSCPLKLPRPDKDTAASLGGGRGGHDHLPFSVKNADAGEYSKARCGDKVDEMIIENLCESMIHIAL